MTAVANTEELFRAEERALKAKVSGINVLDGNGNPRGVSVWIRNPAKEIIESKQPYITIMFEGVTRAADREHRHYPMIPPYVPPGQDVDEVNNTVFYGVEQAIPHDLNFLVSTHTRNPMHDRQLTAELLQVDRLPFRFGWLDVDDNTVRRLDVDPVVRSSDFFDQEMQKVFRKEFRVSVSGEQWMTMEGELDWEFVPLPDTVVATVEEFTLTGSYEADPDKLPP